MNIKRKLRQFFCRHKCNLNSLHIIRQEPRLVKATCIKCGKELKGHCGGALPCQWTKDE